MSADTQIINFELNGENVTATVDPTSRASKVLRDSLRHYGTKIGCDAGDCGACSALIDEELLCSCLVPAARLDGSKVQTVEQKDNAILQALQQSFLAHGAAQCGICTPGMLITATRLLQENPHPNAQQVRNALGGVLCRCTGYQKIIDAIVATPDFKTPAAHEGPAIGSRIARLDGQAKVDGSDVFGADAAPAEALSIRVIRSPYHHARFEFGDLKHFVDSMPGLHALFTAADIPGRNCFGVIPAFADQPVFADGLARYRGEAVAMLVGDEKALLQLDENEIPINWQELTPVLKTTEAMAEGAPQLHGEREGNRLTGGLVERGDIETALADAEIKVSASFSTPFIEHAYIEPEAGFARRVGDTLEIHCCTQAPYMDRDDVAIIMGLTQDQVRIVPTAVGGGFGSKLDLSVQPYLALAAWHCDRPVRLTYTRAESMAATTKRHPSNIDLTVTADHSGKISGLRFDGLFNTGAYASWGPTVANRVPVHASGPYFIPNYRAESHAIHTHTAPAGAFRGFGVPQSAIALECLLDEIAAKVSQDRLAFRLHNALENGQSTVTGQVMPSGVGIKACLQALQPPWDEALARCEKFNADNAETRIRRGLGIASCWYGCGNTSLPNPSTIRVGIRADGGLFIHQAAVDIGQGSNTVITSICADALGLPVQQFQLISADTALSPDGGKTSASRQTYVSGKAAMLSGQALRAQLLAIVDMPDSSTLSLQDQQVIVRDGECERRIDLAERDTDNDGYVFKAEESYDPPTTALDEKGQGTPYAVYGYGAQMVELEVDEALGKIKLLKLTAAHDVGRAINRNLIEGQIQGGCAQGIGLALMEEFIPGRSENLHDYLIPTVGDMPDFECLIIEEEDAEGPFGAKGLGEHVLIPTAPAILNAIRHASGVLIKELPATPDKVRTAIKLRGEQ
jgi:CO/xanthine dehydrogenase Mo-binding subunit/aerobic-type carbon monoxide dehydrogenase small subunit (CoxS/CutS family)